MISVVIVPDTAGIPLELSLLLEVVGVEPSTPSTMATRTQPSCHASGVSSAAAVVGVPL